MTKVVGTVGSLANVLFRELESHAKDAENVILGQAIAHLYGKTLTPESALVSIAEIAGVRRLVEDAKASAMKSIKENA